MTKKTFQRVQILSMLGMALLIALPYFLYTFRSEYQGLVPFRTNDDGFYMGRLDAVLEQRFSEFQNGITGPRSFDCGATRITAGSACPAARGVAPALLELLGGLLFFWTGLHGPQLSVILTVLLAPLTIPLLTALLRHSGVRRSLALTASLLYVFTFLGPLQRPIYMSLALPLAIGALLSLTRMWQDPRPFRVVLTALLIASLPAVYFWDFSFVWAVAGWFFLLHLFLLPASPWKKERTHVLLLSAGLVLLASAPVFLSMGISSLAYPFSTEVALRNQIVHTRIIESLPRNILLTVLTFATIVLIRHLRLPEEKMRTALLPLALVLGAWTVMHQNLVHGLLLSFASHYYPFVCLAMVAVAAWSLERAPRSILRHTIVGITAVFLIAGVWDYRMAFTLPFASRAHLEFQHLAPALASFSDGKRQVILTDYRTAQMVTNWTDDDTVFTPYVRHLLVSNQEFAERYCLSEMLSPLGPDIHWVAWETVQLRAQNALAAREREFRAVCDALLREPKSALQKYGVDSLLWNERERPLWRIPPSLFEKVMAGDGWSVWRRR